MNKKNAKKATKKNKITPSKKIKVKKITRGKNNAEKKKQGRPTKYEDLLEIPLIEFATMLASYGLMDDEIARKCGISRSTLSLWKTKYPNFSDALKEAKQVPDKKVERSLYERAIGYFYRSEKIFCSKDGLVTRVPFIAHSVPEVTAQIFYLKNRLPELWRDRHEIENSFDLGKTITDAYNNKENLQGEKVNPDTNPDNGNE